MSTIGSLAVMAAASLFAAAGATPALENPIGHEDMVRWGAAWSSHDIDQVMALFTPDVLFYQPSNPKPLDAAAARKFFGMIFKTYPDFHVEVTDEVISGLRAVAIERVTGTWLGPYTDPVTGKTTQGNGRKFDHPGAMVLRYQPDHRISEVKIFWDQLMVERQLGKLPPG